jgi:hypothetical protein
MKEKGNTHFNLPLFFLSHKKKKNLLELEFHQQILFSVNLNLLSSLGY